MEVRSKFFYQLESAYMLFFVVNIGHVLENYDSKMRTRLQKSDKILNISQEFIPSRLIKPAYR